MDRNSITAVLLIMLLLIGWSYFFAPKPKEPQSKESITQNTDSSNVTNLTQQVTQDTLDRHQDIQLEDSIDVQTKLNTKYGNFSNLIEGRDTIYNIETDVMKIGLSSKGGLFSSIQLNQFYTYDSLPLPIFPKSDHNFISLNFGGKGRLYQTKDFYFEPINLTKKSISGDTQYTFSMRASLEQNRYIEHRYTIYGNSYHIDYDFILVGLENELTNDQIELTKQVDIPLTEKSHEKMHPEVTLCYKYNKENDIEKLDISKEHVVHNDEVIDDSNIDVSKLQYIKWVAFKSQFFSSAVVFDKKNTSSETIKRFERADLFTEPLSNDQTVKRMRASLTFPYKHQNKDTTSFMMYFGPNDKYILDDYEDLYLDKIISLGWGPLRYITLLILGVFKFLENYISNYGIIILILAVFIKLLLHFFTYKSYLSTSKMQIVNKMPEIKDLEEKYKDNPTELQQKKMAFYQKVGINPFGGCLPLLFQFPILISMFNFFPQSIELRQKQFLWADDLSTYDSVLDFGFEIPFYGDHVSLFTLLMTISTVLYTYIQQKSQGNTGPPQMKYLGYIMPVIFLGVFNNYSSGLSYYYLTFNLLTIGQTYMLKAFINQEKLKQKIHESKKNNKKSKSRIEKWVENQQKKQKQLSNQSKGKRR